MNFEGLRRSPQRRRVILEGSLQFDWHGALRVSAAGAVPKTGLFRRHGIRDGFQLDKDDSMTSSVGPFRIEGSPQRSSTCWPTGRLSTSIRYLFNS